MVITDELKHRVYSLRAGTAQEYIAWLKENDKVYTNTEGMVAFFEKLRPDSRVLVGSVRRGMKDFLLFLPEDIKGSSETEIFETLATCLNSFLDSLCDRGLALGFEEGCRVKVPEFFEGGVSANIPQ